MKWSHNRDLIEEEKEFALKSVTCLSGKNIEWQTVFFQPAALVSDPEQSGDSLMQMFSVSTNLRSCRLTFTACSKILIPSGLGVLTIFIEYGRESHIYSTQSLNYGYDENTITHLLNIDNTRSSIINICKAMIKYVDTHSITHNIIGIDELSSQSREEKNWRNPIVLLVRQLMDENKIEIFQEIVLDIEYRAQLLEYYGLK